jgi:hypothetical protein
MMSESYHPFVSFLPIFDVTMAGRLSHRSEPIRKLLEAVEHRIRTLGRPPVIVETGCMAIDGEWASHGYSTMVFDGFVEHHQGWFVTIDSDPQNAAYARRSTSKHTFVLFADSACGLGFLTQLRLSDRIDLLYLDAHDFNELAGERAFFDLVAAGALSPGCIVAIDDAVEDGFGGLTGPGSLVGRYAARVDLRKLTHTPVASWVVR